MKQFLVVVFGGMAAILAGIVISYGGAAAWRAALPRIRSVSAPSMAAVAAAVMPAPTDGTMISGLRRTIRWTADDEEDVLAAAAASLPSAGDNRISAPAYIVEDLTGGGRTISHDADKLMPIASLSKLAAAVVARQLISPSAHITITRNIMSTYGNTAQFKVGETFTASDLLYPLLMVSSNDAAEAYAQYYGRAKFIQAMNDFTQSIGAYRTSFSDPSGLSPQNVSTASDLALILDWIRRNDPDIMSITELKQKTVRSHTWVNPTHFLSWSNYDGGKNGYLPEANRTAASLFTVGPNKDIYAVIVLGSASRDTDEIKLLGMVNGDNQQASAVSSTR